MSNIAGRLRLKYGLVNDPDYQEIREYRNRLQEYVALGDFLDEAGEKAAKDTFSEYRKYFYKSQSDTVEMLLRLIAEELGS